MIQVPFRIYFLLVALHDDLKIFRVVNNRNDAEILQNDLNSVFDWSIKNQLPLNVNKCVSITFTKKTNKVDYIYSIGSCLLSKLNTIKDLGVTIDSRLRFDKHVDEICRKGSKS